LASYRYAIIADSEGADGLRVIDLGAGHASGGSLTARVVAALKAEGLLNESVGAGYIERNWPTALRESGCWPLKGLRQSFLNGALTRLLDPEEVLRKQIVTFVERGDFGFGSGPRPGGAYERIWCKEPFGPEEVVFDDKTFLLTRARVASFREAPKEPVPVSPAPQEFRLEPTPSPLPESSPGATPPDQPILIHLRGTIPPEQWNKLGTKLLPKLRTSGQDLTLGLEASLTVHSRDLKHVAATIRTASMTTGTIAIIASAPI